MSPPFKETSGLPRGRITGIAPSDIAAAAAALLAGDLVGMPTETVYGLAADATQGEAVAAIYDAKGRPAFNPLISHVADLESAQKHGLFNADALKLAHAFWPGPLTLIVPFRPGSPVSDLARAGLDSIGLRVPAHPAARALLQAAGRPVAAPSANLSGRISPTAAVHVAHDMGDKTAMVLDGGFCDVGVESTIISCLDGVVRLLRPGGIARQAVEAIIGRSLSDTENGAGIIRSPGLLPSHYAPLAPVRMNLGDFRPGDAILAFGASQLPHIPALTPVLNLSPQGNLRQAAARLFSALRDLDALSPAAIIVAPIPRDGLGEAIHDRLCRAAAPRQ
jgi:L-threonylcarbamoyladenylate synthase